MDWKNKFKEIKFISLFLMIIINCVSLLNVWVHFYWIDEIAIILINILYYLILFLFAIFYRLFYWIKLKDILKKDYKLSCKSKWINKTDENNLINETKYLLNIKIKFKWFSTNMIYVSCETNNSNSQSSEANVQIIDKDININYYYKNTINEISSLPYLYNHEGKAKLVFRDNQLKNFYYSNNDNRRISWLESFNVQN